MPPRGWMQALLGPCLVAGCAEAEAPLACSALDPALTTSAFVLVEAPPSGARVTSPLHVTGCSRTNESNVLWELRGRDGRVLASGFTTGGGVDGAAPFALTATFEVTRAELGSLEVSASDASDGEGFPPPRTILPVVLAPTSDGGPS